MNVTHLNPHNLAPVSDRAGQGRRERTLDELRGERDRMLAAGRLRVAAELTTWIDELTAESARLRAG